MQLCPRAGGDGEPALPDAAAQTAPSRPLPQRLALYGANLTAAALLAGYGLLTYQHAQTFQNDVAFWRYIVERNPQAHSGFYNLGLALVDAGQVQAGIAAYREDLARSRERGEDGGAGTYINLSFALLQLEDFEEAARVARLATQVDPKALLGHQNLASALHQLQRYEETLAALKAVDGLMKRPTAEHRFHMGHIASLLGRTQEAEGYLLQSLQLDPGYQDARYQLLDTYLEAGLYGKARRLFPDDLGQRLAHMAAARFNEDDFAGALKNYRHAVAIAPDDADAHVNMGAILTRLERADEALASYRRALELDPQHQPGLTQLAHAHFNAGRYEQAIAAYRRLAALAPEDAKTQVSIGMAQAQLQRPQEAEASFARALALEPQQQDALSQLAGLYFNTRRYDQALEIYQRLATLLPDSADAQSNLGSALAQTGRYRQAIASFQRALALDPQLASAQVNIQLARQKLAESQQ